MHVYELNEKDRGSLAYQPFSFNFDFFKLLPKGALGDLVPFTNKVKSYNYHNNSNFFTTLHYIICVCPHLLFESQIVAL